MANRLKRLRRRHDRFKAHYDAPSHWKAQISVGELDFLLRKLDKLKDKVDRLEPKKPQPKKPAAKRPRAKPPARP